MSGWILNKYRDRHDPLCEPQSVGVYETDEGVLDAVADMKRASMNCLPIVFCKGEKVEILHVVSRNHTFDALFQSIKLAHDWLDRRYYECELQRPEMPVSYTLHSILVDTTERSFTAPVPKSVWEWLREPAL